MGNLSDYLFLQTYLKGQRWLSGVQSFQRPGDVLAYAAPTSGAVGDLIAQSTAAANACLPLQFQPPLLDVSDPAATIRKGVVSFVALHDVSGAASKTIRAHVMKKAVAPTVATVDNTGININNLAAGEYLGFVDLTLQPAAMGGAFGANDLARIPYELAQGESLWTFHEAQTAFTPPNAGVYREWLATDRQQ